MLGMVSRLRSLRDVSSGGSGLGKVGAWSIAFACLGAVAQRLEQGTHNPLVAGSIPACPTRRHLRVGFVQDPVSR